MKRPLALLASLALLAGCHLEYHHEDTQATTSVADASEVQLALGCQEGEILVTHEGGDLVIKRRDRTVVLRDAAALGALWVHVVCTTTDGPESVDVKATFVDEHLLLEWRDDALSFAGQEHSTAEPGRYLLDATGALRR